MGKVKFKNLENTLKKIYLSKKKENLNSYPLLDDAFTFEDLNRGIDVIFLVKLQWEKLQENLRMNFQIL